MSPYLASPCGPLEALKGRHTICAVPRLAPVQQLSRLSALGINQRHVAVPAHLPLVSLRGADGCYQ
jgi:hypothetical protein